MNHDFGHNLGPHDPITPMGPFSFWHWFWMFWHH